MIGHISRLRSTSVLFLSLGCLCFGQNQTINNGKNIQSAGVNNGTMYQNNVSPEVERELKELAKRESGSETGWLQTIVPAHDPPLSTSCKVKPDELTIFFGKSGASASCQTNECKIVADESKDAPNPDLLSLERKGRSLLMHAVVLDETGKVVAVVDRNKTHANPNNAFTWARPDSHTVDIVDQYNRMVLHARFANPTTFVLTGTFHASTGSSLEIADDEMSVKYKTRTFNSYRGGFCFGDNGIDIVLP